MLRVSNPLNVQIDTISSILIDLSVLFAISSATHVPVGADQTQHLEFTRELARIMNHSFAKRNNPLFVEPECIFNTEAARVMSLKNATQKMSKSDPSAASRICLTDSDNDIRTKIKGAQTGKCTYANE